MEIWAFAMRNDRNRSKLHAKQPINPRANVHTGAEQIKQHIQIATSTKGLSHLGSALNCPNALIRN
jgi:hypothetical protein